MQGSTCPACKLPRNKDIWRPWNCSSPFSPVSIQAKIASLNRAGLFLPIARVLSIGFYPHRAGSFEMAEVLLEAGEDANVPGANLETPLQLAEEGGHEDIVALLHRYKATVGWTFPFCKIISLLLRMMAFKRQEQNCSKCERRYLGSAKQDYFLILS